jgi:hypothetical protein
LTIPDRFFGGSIGYRPFAADVNGNVTASRPCRFRQRFLL